MDQPQRDPRQLPPGFVLDAPQEAAASGNLSSQEGSGQLPPGLTLLDPGAPPAANYGPGLLGRLGGIVGRGVLEGASGVAATAQAAGRWTEAHSPYLPIISDLDGRVDALPVQQLAGSLADKANLYRPQQASGKILEGAVGGATGAALTGGSAVLPMVMAGGAGAAVPLAKAAGASDGTAADVGLATALLPIGGVGAIAARNAAGAVARNAYVGSVARSMTPDQAAQHVLLNDALNQYAASAGKQLTPAQTVQGYSTMLNDAATQYRKLATAAGIIDGDQGSTLMSAQKAANAGTGGAADARAASLPGYHADAVSGALGQLGALAGRASTTGAVGPIASTISKLTPIAAGVSALGAAHSGDWLSGAELAGAALAGKAVPGVNSALGKLGGLGDVILGSSMTPAQAQLAAAQKIVRRNGLDTSGNPLADLQAAISDARGTIQDNATNAANDTADALKAKQTDAAYRQNAQTQAAAEQAWQRALSQQAQQNAVNPLAASLWKDAAQQTGAPNLGAVTNSQVRGFNADQGALATRDAQEQAAQSAMQSRGQSLNEQAGAWLERQRLRQFAANNPDVPVTGAAALSAQTPDQLFAATGGRFGSPANSDAIMASAQQQVMQAPRAGAVPGPLQATPGASPGPSTAVPATPPPAQLQAPSTSLQQPPAGLPTGGLSLAQMIHRDYYPQQGLPTHEELASAVNDLAADGTLHPLHADLALSGQNISRGLAAQIADRVATGRGLPGFLPSAADSAELGDAQRSFVARTKATADQATADVQQAMGAPVGSTPMQPAKPNGGPRGPIQNMSRWKGAVRTYQDHADDMAAIATSADEKQAILQIKAEKTAAGKAAIRDDYASTHSGASLTRFTPQLMKGV